MREIWCLWVKNTKLTYIKNSKWIGNLIIYDIFLIYLKPCFKSFLFILLIHGTRSLYILSILISYLNLVILMISPFKLPSPLEYTIRTVGNCTLSISMILIGTMLGELKDIKSIFTFILFKYAVIRLVIIPLLALVICKVGNIGYLSTGVIVLLSGMPAGSTTAILASKYNGDYIFASQAIVFSTIMSILTIPHSTGNWKS